MKFLNFPQKIRQHLFPSCKKPLMFRKIFSSRHLRLMLVTCFLLAACSQTQPRKVSSIQELLAALKDLDEERGMRNGFFSFSMKQVKNDETLINHNADKSVVIASNMKVVTTAAALDILGENFTFPTRLEYDGMLANGILNGNLYVTGGGDPTLGSRRVTGSLGADEIMDVWVKKVKALGIRQINGNVIGDADFFEENATPEGWTWGDMGNYYGAASFGLNFNDNLYRLTFKSAKESGMPTQIARMEPQISDLSITSNVKTGTPESGDNAYIHGSMYGNYQFIEGTIPSGIPEFSIKGAVPDPPKMCVQVLSQYLTRSRIGITGTATTTRLTRRAGKPVNTDRKLIYIHNSPTLKEIVYQTNLYSMNLYAETLMKMAGKKVYQDGSTSSGVNAIRTHWFEKGIKNAGFFMRDGSGLSRSNATTTSQLTDILLYTSKQNFFGTFYNSLPVAGASGTMAPLCRGTIAAGNVRAKTGTIDRVKSYTGYFRSQSGELYAFSLVANDYEMSGDILQEKVEKVMTLMASLP
jgi:serine-type D-Ala-D-Ala carboxypeptidase/endopeptidase (penicillin-binding protein 4)